MAATRPQNREAIVPERGRSLFLSPPVDLRPRFFLPTPAVLGRRNDLQRAAGGVKKLPALGARPRDEVMTARTSESGARWMLKPCQRR
jgi:hypothetical protein